MLLINSTNQDEIIRQLSDAGVKSFHATNGTYAYGAEMIVPTTLAGFAYLSDQKGNENDVFLIAVNSDISMRGILEKKGASSEEFDALEDQETRAMKVAVPLQKANPNRQVIVLFYDEETPTPLYDAIAENGSFRMKSLHKWGYGTDPDAPKIEGEHNFETVYGFPLPNDTKPLCHNITAHEDQSGFVKVVKLDKYLPAARETAGYPQPRHTA